MIHEAMVLEYSGRYLALVEWASAVKHFVFLSLLANLFVPWGVATSHAPLDLARGLGALLIKLVALAVSVAFLETRMAKLRLFRVPELLSLSFVLAHNVNGAMGFLRQIPTDTRRAVLVAFALLASILMVKMAEKTRDSATRLALALTLGGALGNLIDRALRGAVVDFIDVVYAPGRHWHTFNVADIAVVVGAGLLALRSFGQRETLKTPSTVE